MDLSIRRPEREAAPIRERPPRRRRGEQDEEFERELDSAPPPPRRSARRDAPPAAPHEDLPVARPADDEAGGRIDLTA